MLATVEKTDRLEYWPLLKLRANPRNPRGPVDPSSLEELVASIRAQGILQALLITPDGTVVAGHRRLAAAFLACLSEVPVVVRDFTPNEQMEIMLVENLQREDLTPLQEAKAYRAMMDAGYRQTDVARKVGVTTSRIHLRLTLLKLDQQVQEMMERADLPMVLAPVLTKVADPAMQRRLAMLASRRRLTVQQLEDIVAQGQGVFNKPERPRLEPVRPAVEPEEGEGNNRDSVTRKQAVELLMSDASRPVTLATVARFFDDTCGVCGDCGMASLESVCQECPMPQLAARIAAR